MNIITGTGMFLGATLTFFSLFIVETLSSGTLSTLPIKLLLSFIILGLFTFLFAVIESALEKWE